MIMTLQAGEKLMSLTDVSARPRTHKYVAVQALCYAIPVAVPSYCHVSLRCRIDPDRSRGAEYKAWSTHPQRL